MKKTILFTLLLVMAQGHSQKKKNGTIFLEHPAIDVVNSFNTAFVAGDHEKVGTYLAEDFKVLMALAPTKTLKDVTKSNFWSE